MTDFNAVIAGASRKDQWSAVNRAIELRGKLKGFLIDRVEIGAPGSFDRCETSRDVAERMVEEWGLDNAISFTEYMLGLLREIASERARLVS